MLANRGELNGKRLLGPKTVDLMSSVFVPDTPISNGSFGWDGAYGTHFWVDPKEKIVGIFMIQAAGGNRLMNPDFENAVMQALIDPEARP